MKRGILIFIAICGVLHGSFLKAKERDADTDAVLKYVRACSAVKDNYVDSVNIDSLTATAVQAMVSSLDPHSTYLTKEQVRISNELLFDGFEGIGCRYSVENDTVIVLQVVEGGPSETAGLMPADKILFADTTAIAGVGISSAELQRIIRGPKGSLVNLTVLRCADTLKIPVKRDKVDVHGVSSSFMLTPSVGFVRVDYFSEGSGDEFEKDLLALSKSGAVKFVLDFRGNSGGLLNEAVQMLSCLLPSGTELYTAQGVHRGKYTAKAERRRHHFLDAPVVVLIDGGSASASEVFAGALQDWNRAVIVGSRSFGKGMVQQSYPLGDGSEIRLTVARYYTPSGRDIQRPYKKGEYVTDELGGIIPDVSVEVERGSVERMKCYYLKDSVIKCEEVKKAVEILENK